MAIFLLLVTTSFIASWVIINYLPAYAPSQSLYWTAFFLTLVPTAAWGAWCCIVYPKLLSPFRHLPQPSGGSFLLGHFWRLATEPTAEALRGWVNEIPNDGLILYSDFLNWERLAVVKPRALAEVMTTHSYDYIKPPHVRKGLGIVFGTGLVWLEGDKHKIQRKELMPAFSFRHIRDLYPIFWEKSRELVESVRAYTRDSRGDTNSVVDVGEWARRATLDMIGLAGLGYDLGTIKNPENELSRIYQRVCSPSKTALMMDLLGFSSFLRLFGALVIKFTDDFVRARSDVRRHCYSLIELKKQSLRKADVRHSVDILSVALQSAHISDDMLVNHLTTFLLAGHETTSSAFSWVIYYLCKYPNVQKRLRDEIKACLPQDATWRPTATEIDNLRYLHAVCMEVLRLRPVVPQVPRVASVDTSILGHFIPKGTVIIVSPWAVNTSMELWGEDALEFKPERWMGADRANTGGATNAYSFFAFGKGPRSCIGENFAKAELACLVAAWAGAFETEFAEKESLVKIDNGISTRPARLVVKLKVADA